MCKIFMGRVINLSGIKRIFVSVIIVSVLALLGFFYTQGKYVKLGATGVVSKNTVKPKVLILYWGFPWGEISYVPPEGALLDNNCGVTHQRNRINEADAVVFHFTTIHSDDMPWHWYRNPNQTFIWWSAENSAVLYVQANTIKWSAFDGFFNWTWTYRSDADIVSNYGYRGGAIKTYLRGKKVVDDIINAKQKLAVWIVSKCSYTKGARLRMTYANQLRQAGIDFDGFGKCFSKQIPRLDYSHMKKIIRKYKFYFAFENGLHCKDYVTEKFWHNAIANDAVPVVWGPTKNDILRIAPLDSFIFAEDFQTPQNLAKYLKFLDSNDEEYRKYFRWREDENMTDEIMINMTRKRFPELNVQERPLGLCEKLMKNNSRKVVESLVAQFFDNPKECSV